MDDNVVGAAPSPFIVYELCITYFLPIFVFFFYLFIFSLFMDMEEWLLFVRAMRRLCDGVVTQRCWPSPSTGWQTHFRLMRKLLETVVSTAEDNHSSVSNTWVTLTCQSVFTNLINRLCTLRGSGIENESLENLWVIDTVLMWEIEFVARTMQRPMTIWKLGLKCKN